MKVFSSHDQKKQGNDFHSFPCVLKKNFFSLDELKEMGTVFLRGYDLSGQCRKKFQKTRIVRKNQNLSGK